MAARTELITVERETHARRAGGGMTSGWASVGQLWAEAKWLGGGEAEVRGAVRETVRYRFTVLAAGAEAMALTARDRIVWNGERYNIREAPRRLPRGVKLEIIAEAGVTQ